MASVKIYLLRTVIERTSQPLQWTQRQKQKLTFSLSLIFLWQARLAAAWCFPTPAKVSGITGIPRIATATCLLQLWCTWKKLWLACDGLCQNSMFIVLIISKSNRNMCHPPVISATDLDSRVHPAFFRLSLSPSLCLSLAHTHSLGEWMDDREERKV